MKKKKKKEFALYKGEDLLCIGTIKEIAEDQDVKEDTIRFYKTPTYKKRHLKSKSGNYKILIELD